MEQSRYQPFNRLYILGLLCLLLGFFSLGFALYLFPMVFLNIQVDAPLFLYKLLAWVQQEYYLLQDKALSLIWGFFLCLGLILILIADLTSNYIDNQLLRIKKQTETYVSEDEKEMIQTKHIVIILCIVILLVLGAMKIFEVSIVTSSLIKG
jgi:hypothetical protein